MPFPLQLKAHLPRIDARLDELLPPETQPPTKLHAAMRYSCLLPGKRLRPILCLASAAAIDPESEVLNAACAIEMVHCFSLIHDDLPAIDNDDLRRGAPTLHREFGEAIAILAGDALFALAFQTLASIEQDPARVMAAVQRLTQASGSTGLVGGEVADILSEGKEVPIDQLEFIHSRKTGALMAASCEIGALLAGANPEQAQSMRQFGMQLGLAFQIADDVLNETSTPEELGKATGSDRQRNKATYPAMFGIEKSRAMAQTATRKALEALASAGVESKALGELAAFAVDRGQ